MAVLLTIAGFQHNSLFYSSRTKRWQHSTVINVEQKMNARGVQSPGCYCVLLAITITLCIINVQQFCEVLKHKWGFKVYYLPAEQDIYDHLPLQAAELSTCCLRSLVISYVIAWVPGSDNIPKLCAVTRVLSTKVCFYVHEVSNNFIQRLGS